MDAMSLFTLGMLAGIAVIYAIILYVKVATNYPEREMKLPERETYLVGMEMEVPAQTMTEEEFNAGMDALFEIFAIK